MFRIIIELPLTITVLKPNDTFGGRTYSDWIEQWSNYLVSSSVDYNSGEQILFLRGNLDYEEDKSGKRFIKPGKFLDKTGSLGETIYNNTAVFIPIMTAMFSLNDPHESIQLLDEGGLRYAVRRDISEGGEMWLRYKDSSPSSAFQTVVTNIQDYYFETPVFTLRVSSENPLLTKFESPTDPGDYETVQGGYFVIVKNLTPGKYRFHFGGHGRGYYYTDAVYDINVQSSKSRDLTKDISSQNKSKGPTGPKDLKKFLHLKTEDDIDNSSPFP